MGHRLSAFAGFLTARLGLAVLLALCGGVIGAACAAAPLADRGRELPAGAAAVVALIGGMALLRLATRSVAVPLAYAALLLLGLWLLTPSERIVFASDRDTPGRTQIYALDVGGSNVDRLSATPGQDDAPSVSPDGRRIAFTRRIDGREQLFTAARQGEEPVALPGGEGNSHRPAWSPDGRWLAFASDRGGDWDIYIASPDGARLRSVGAHPARDDWPTWSPDGRALAFESDRGGGPGLWIVDADGTAPHPFRADGVARRMPAWSPGGELAFVAGERAEAVCVAGFDGAAQRCLASGGYYAAPAWSPSGGRLAYAARGPAGWAVLTVAASGGPSQDASRHPGTNTAPAWGSNAPIAALGRWWARLVG